MLAGHELLDDLRHGYCLQGVRLIVERALGLRNGQFYARWGVARTTGAPADRADWSWWAADIERSMKELGFAVPAVERKPGDLVFNHQAAKPVGHVGIYLGHGMVMEVVSPAHRPNSFHRRNICVTPWGDWQPTLVARLPQEPG